MYENTLEIIKWVVSHLITWACLNCMLVGGWYIYSQVKTGKLLEEKVQVASLDDYNFDGLTKDQLEAVVTRAYQAIDEKKRNKG